MIKEFLAYLNPYLPAHILLKAIFIAVGFYLASQLIVWISEKILLKLAAKTATEIDDLIIKRTNYPLSIILIILGIYLALLSLNMTPASETLMQKIIVTIISIIIGVIISRVIDILIEHGGTKIAKRTKSTLDDAIIPLMRRMTRIVVFILVGLYILHFWGFEITPLLASLGVAGIAVAFALQNVLGNIFGGISLTFDRTIKVGDVVQINTDNNKISGTILDVGLRSTKVKTFDNEVVIIPNGPLAQAEVQNLVMPDPSCRVTVEFSVEYGSNPDKVKKIALGILKGVKDVLKTPEPSCWFTELGDNGLQFKLYFFVKTYEIRVKKKDEVNTKLYNALNKAKIGIPFPTRTIIMKKGRR